MPGFSSVATHLGSTAMPVETLSDLDIGPGVGGALTLYATSRTDLSVTRFDIGAATITLRDQTGLPAGLSAMGDLGLELLTLGGSARAVSLIGGAAGLPSYARAADGRLSASTTYLSASGLGSQLSGLATAEIGGVQYLYAGGRAGLAAFQLTDAGGLKPQGSVAADISALLILELGGRPYLYAASASSDQVLGYALGAGGKMTVTASLGAADGLGIDAPTVLEQARVAGTDYLIVAARGSSSLSVLQIGANGALTATDHVVDDLTSRFQNITAMDVIEANGRVYVVAGGADDGLSLFTLLPGGKLLHLDAIGDETGVSLANITSVALAATADRLHVFAASATEAGLTRAVVDLDGAGQTLQAGGSGGRLDGSAGADILRGGAGDDSLDGGAGDDILIGGLGSDRLYGGAGADIFVLLADDAGDEIRDFDPDEDTIDLSLWPLLRGAAQLSITSLPNGGLIRFGSQMLRLYSADGTSISAVRIQAAVLASFLHFTTGGLQSGLVLSGGGAGDRLQGGAGNDRLDGGAGADTLVGLGGADSLIGGDGDDGLDGGDGDDSLAGDAGDDSLAGGDGDDTLAGGDGDDGLSGGAGADRLDGGAGQDRLEGGAGADRLQGGTGDDILDGGAGADNLDGGAGADWLQGGAGDDALAGGTEDDILDGGDDDDSLDGGAGNDRLSGGAGADLLTGGDGDDVLLGGPGDDVLRGGNGDDLLNGGSLDPSRSDGADAFHGGAGTDTVSYAGSRGSLRVDMVYSSINTFSARGDTFDSIENLIGSQGADNLRGTTGANRIEGAENVDYIFGRKGDDTLVGGIGDDVLFGGLGADTLIGGAHTDRAQYSESLTALTLDLLDPTRNSGEATGDSYAGIEDLAGSEFGDEIFGDNGGNRLFGRGGDDRLTGRAGNDYLNGGGGQDVLLGGAGDDVLRGGASRDTFVFDGGADLIEDYFLDALRFDDALWGGTALSGAQVLSTYASLVGGDTVFDFGAGDTLTLQGHTDIAGLAGHVSAF